MDHIEAAKKALETGHELLSMGMASSECSDAISYYFKAYANGAVASRSIRDSESYDEESMNIRESASDLMGSSLSAALLGNCLVRGRSRR